MKEKSKKQKKSEKKTIETKTINYNGEKRKGKDINMIKQISLQWTKYRVHAIHHCSQSDLR